MFENSILIEQDEKIEGMISYEIFRGRALIRYFIFDKEVEEDNIVQMYERFFQKLKEKGIKEIFVIISKDIIVEMFSDLGFVEFNKDEFFLTEHNIYETKYRDSKVMCYTIRTINRIKIKKNDIIDGFISKLNHYSSMFKPLRLQLIHFSIHS